MVLLPEDPEIRELAEQELQSRGATLVPELSRIGANALTFEPAPLPGIDLPFRPRPGVPDAVVDFYRRLLHPLPELLLADKERGIVIRTDIRHLTAADAGGSHGGAIGGTGGRWGTSRNWSGAVIAARDGGRFNLVAASWTVPPATPPDGTPSASLPGGVWKQSVWIGLDGYRLHSRSLPQVGTVSMFDPDKVGTKDADGQDYAGEYYVWAQWWVRNKFYGEAVLDRFKVAAGDRISATVEVTAADDVQFVVVNRGREGTAATPTGVIVPWSKGQYFDKFAPGTLVGSVVQGGQSNLGRADAPVEGRHAVWCVERPGVMPPANQIATTKPHEVESYRLPNFADVTFTEALANMRLPDGTSVARDLTAARHIRMIDPSGGPVPRVTFATTPLAPARGGRTMTVDRLGPNAPA